MSWVSSLFDNPATKNPFINPFQIGEGGPNSSKGILNYNAFTGKNWDGSGGAAAAAGGNGMGGMPQLTDSPGYKQASDNALRPGPSTWAQLAYNQQDRARTQALDQGASTVAGQTAKAQADLAGQGGLSSGARERTQEGGAKNYMSMVQDANKQTGDNKLQIGINDEQNKMKSLDSLNQLNTTNYGNQLQAWASNNTANAIQQSGGGGKGGK